MIILESDWNEAAGIQDSEANPPDNADNNALPSYGEVEADQLNNSSRTSVGTPSIPSLRSSQNRSSVLIEPPPSASSANGSIPSERLPNYRDSSDSARTNPVTYAFSHVKGSPNSMNLRSQTAMIPLYHITVHLNCFIPSSYITVITRGDEAGQEVGQFEMGLSVRKGTVTIDGRERLIDAVLSKGGTRLTRTWIWRFDRDPEKHLNWNFDGPVKQCYHAAKNVGALLASFTPPPLTPLPNGRPSPPAALKVYPEGQKAFDHILISALILEHMQSRLDTITLGALNNVADVFRNVKVDGISRIFWGLTVAAVATPDNNAFSQHLQTYVVKPLSPTVLDGHSHYTLRNTDLNLAFKVDTAHIIPGPLDVARFDEALAKTLSVYPLYAGRLRRGQDKRPWQIHLTNDGVPITILYSDAGKEVPHNCIIQSPWTLSQPINVRKQWDHGSDDPLLRVTITQFTKLESTAIGLSASHVVGDGTTIMRFMRLLSQNYQGLEPLDDMPSYTPIPPYPVDTDAVKRIEELPMPVFRNMFSIHDVPPFLRPGWRKALRVDLRFTKPQVAQIQAGVRAMAANEDDARRISRQDALWALLVYCMSRVDPECFPQHLSTIMNSRGIEPRPVTAMTNSLIWALTDPVADPTSETMYSIARRVRESVDRVRQPGFAAAWDAVHDPVALETANSDLAQNFVQPPGDFVLNSTWRFDWASAHFGYEGKTRFFHTQLDAPRFAKMFQPNPEVMPDGSIQPSPYNVEVTFCLYEDARERFKPVLLEEMRRLGVASKPYFVDLVQSCST
ncbi:hypothetical protein NM688_g4560 [Phlebia brevispora]|uniref:Uncharacterized protein n=1 Tax=Phlebia brevispora TaxID=194682 RepID=A0ACC1T2K3_9APHY|nr:hypothetical protein NM688_g4560 [Phlebia brevispora]